MSHQKASYSCAIGVNRETPRDIYKREGTPLTSLAVCRLTKKAVRDDLHETAFSRIAIRDNMASIHPTDYYCCYVLLSREMMKHLRAFFSNHPVKEDWGGFPIWHHFCTQKYKKKPVYFHFLERFRQTKNCKKSLKIQEFFKKDFINLGMLKMPGIPS